MTNREFLLRRALLKALLESKPYVVLDTHLQTDLNLVVPRMTPTEFDAAIRDAEENRLILSVQQDRGKSYTIKIEGEAWLIANAG